MALVAFGYARAYYQDYQVRQEIKELEEVHNNLKVRQFELLDLIKKVSSPEYVEEKARTELNMKKIGEQVIVIDSGNDVTSTKKSDAVDEKPLSNPIKWWYYFTHKGSKQ